MNFINTEYFFNYVLPNFHYANAGWSLFNHTFHFSSPFPNSIVVQVIIRLPVHQCQSVCLAVEPCSVTRSYFSFYPWIRV